MNEKFKQLALEAKMGTADFDAGSYYVATPDRMQKFTELIVEAVLDQVKERAYYTGDRTWSDELDRPWIQLEFGYGALHDAKTVGS